MNNQRAADEWLAGNLIEYRERMLSLARSIVKNPEDAEDVVQEALLRAWRFRASFTRGRVPAPWLLKITRNAAFDFLRSRSETERTDFDGVSSPLEPPEQRVVVLEEARSLASAMQRLAPAHRTAFVLHDVHGYSSREIAARAHVPYQTVRTHLLRARRQLRRELLGA
jgi:RNA polymerase sigma factor (sigma-70 family)